MNEETFIRKCIKEQRCPFCKNKRRFTVLAAHTSHAHGITAYQLREMAGLARVRSICDPVHREYLSAAQKEKMKRFPNLLSNLEKAWGKPRTDATWRPETREKQLKDRRSPKRKQIFKERMSRLTHEERSQAAKNVSAEVNADRTQRIINAHNKWREKVGPEVVSERSRKAGLSVKHETHVKSAQLAKKKLHELHADKNWKADWYKKLMGNMHRKIPIAEYPVIVARMQRGDRVTQVARDYNVTHKAISNLIERLKNKSE